MRIYEFTNYTNKEFSSISIISKFVYSHRYVSQKTMQKALEKMNEPESNGKKKIFFSLIAVLAVLAAAYGVCVGQTIFNVVARASAEKQIAKLNAQVSDLESKYMEAESQITIDYAYSKGFSDVSASEFVSKKPVAKGLSMSL